MRVVLALALALIAFPAAAEDFEVGEAAYDQVEAMEQCVTGKDDQGAALSSADREEACSRQVEIAATLGAEGYCFQRETSEWARCE